MSVIIEDRPIELPLKITRIQWRIWNHYRIWDQYTYTEGEVWITNDSE